MLVSTVRTCPESDVDQRPTKSWLKRFLGFLVDPHQVNVAITRAQEGLCLIGEGCLAGRGSMGRGGAAGRGLRGRGCLVGGAPRKLGYWAAGLGAGGAGLGAGGWGATADAALSQETTSSCAAALCGAGSWTSVRPSRAWCPPTRCGSGRGQPCLPEDGTAGTAPAPLSRLPLGAPPRGIREPSLVTAGPGGGGRPRQAQ